MEVLQRRVIPTANGSVEQGLTLWSGWPSGMVTWENLLQLRQAFPRAPAWGQAGSKGPGVLTAHLLQLHQKKRPKYLGLDHALAGPTFV